MDAVDLENQSSPAILLIKGRRVDVESLTWACLAFTCVTVIVVVLVTHQESDDVSGMYTYRRSPPQPRELC
jgi:hypothetical protein